MFSCVSDEVVETIAHPDAASNINEIINDHFIKDSRSSDKLQIQTFSTFGQSKNIELPEDVDLFFPQS